MWRYTEKGLTRDDKRRDVKERIRGQIMKGNTVIIHHATYTWVKGKPEPADKMGEEHDPHMGLRSRDNLSRRWKVVADFLGQVPGLPKLFDILLLDSRGHPLASCSGSGYFQRTFVGGEDERAGVRAQAKENG